MKIIILSVILLVFVSVGCSQNNNDEIKDIIAPISLVEGQSDTLYISDLFYAENYDLAFTENRDILIKFDKSSLILSPRQNFEGYTTIAFKLNNHKYCIPVLSRIRQKFGFKFKPATRPVHRMNVMGNFNDWNRSSLPMSDDDGDGVYEREVALDPGQYFYQFVTDNGEIWDPANPVKADNGFGSYNSVFFIEPRHKDKAFLHIKGYQDLDSEVRINFYYERENQADDLKVDDITALKNNVALDEHHIAVSGNEISLSFARAELSGENVIRLAITQKGQATNLQTIRLFDGKPAGSDKFAPWHDAIIYSIMIDRFVDGDKSNNNPVKHDSLLPKVNYFGGDLAGILQKLDEGYFEKLGVNTLWLSPVNANTDAAFREWPAPHRYFSAYHGYWPTHHEKVEERFGDLELLKKLVARTHKKGMRVLLDFIGHHTHIDHPFFKEHRDWFGTYELPDGRKNIRLWDEYRLTTWFEPFLPSFDYESSSQALATMTDNAIWWLKQTDVDGFRHDAVKHIPNIFWRTLTRKIKTQVEIPGHRKIYQIGETFGSYKLVNSYISNGQLNGQFNYNLYDTALYVFLNSGESFEILARELAKTFSVHGANNLMGNVMSSHDKVRYMVYADNDIRLNSGDAMEIGWQNPPEVNHAASYAKAQLYLSYLLTIPGIPVIYYGDEFGMTGLADPDNRRMMRFDSDLTDLENRMLEDVARIIQIRAEHPALRYGDFQTLFADNNCFVYLRSDLNERILVAINKSGESQTLSLLLPQFYQIRQGLNLINNDILSISNNQINLKLNSLSSNIYKIE